MSDPVTLLKAFMDVFDTCVVTVFHLGGIAGAEAIRSMDMVRLAYLMVGYGLYQNHPPDHQEQIKAAVDQLLEKFGVSSEDFWAQIKQAQEELAEEGGDDA